MDDDRSILVLTCPCAVQQTNALAIAGYLLIAAPLPNLRSGLPSSATLRLGGANYPRMRFGSCRVSKMSVT